MKLLFVLLFLGLGLKQCMAQHWNNIQQASLGVIYDLPQAWYVGGHTQQDACNCIGTTVNSSPEGDLSMLVVVGNGNAPNFLTQPIWGYEFVQTEYITQQLELKNIYFEERISTWKQSTKDVVLQFAGKIPNNNRIYVLYFWGNLEAIQTYSSTIERIIKSFKSLQ